MTISGYKPFELGIFQKDHPSVAFIKLAIQKQLIRLIDEGLEWVLISGQLGVELWAAEVIFDLQADFPNLKLAVLTPFLDQEKSWNEKNQEWYHSVLARADFVDSITKRSYESPRQFRLKNQFLIEKSDAILLFYDQEKEGSPKYIYDLSFQFQKKHSYSIHSISFYDLQDIIEEEQLKRSDFS